MDRSSIATQKCI